MMMKMLIIVFAAMLPFWMNGFAAGYEWGGTWGDCGIDADCDAGYCCAIKWSAPQCTAMPSDNCADAPGESNVDPNFDDNAPVVGGYFGEWTAWARDFPTSDIDPSKYTHLFYAFYDLDAQGNVIEYDPKGKGISEFIDLPGPKKLISIGGWTLSKHFYAVAKNPQLRQQLYKTSIEQMKK
eukprot:363839_1